MNQPFPQASRYIKVINFLYLFTVAGVGLGLLLAAWWFSTHSYSQLVYQVVQQLGREDLHNVITQKFFPESKWQLLYQYHFAYYFMIVLLVITAVLCRQRVVSFFINALRFIFISGSNIIQWYAMQARGRRLWFITILMVYASWWIYLAITKTISYDEAWGYNYYLSKPFYFPLVLFNTYPLYNFITHFFTYLPFSQELNIRLPAIVFGLLSLLTLYYILCKLIRKQYALLVVLLLAASPLFTTYSLLGKGISMALWLAIVAYYAFLQLFQKQDEPRYLFMFGMVNVLGISTIPSFVLFTASMLVAGFFFSSIPRFRLFKMAVTIAAVSMLFYLPMIITAGSSVAFHSEVYGSRYDVLIHNFYKFIQIFSWLFFTGKQVLVIVLLLSIGYLLFYKKTRKDQVFLSSLVIVFLVLIFQMVSGLLLPDRALSFVLVPLLFMIGKLLEQIMEWIGKMIERFVVIGLAMGLIILMLINQQQVMRSYEDDEAKKLAALLLEHNVKRIYLEEKEFWIRVPMIQFYYAQQDHSITFYTSATNSTRYKPFDADDNYHCIVADEPRLLNQGYKKLYESKEFVLVIKP